MSNTKLQNVRGTKDLFADEIKLFNHVINIAKKHSELFNFEESKQQNIANDDRNIKEKVSFKKQLDLEENFIKNESSKINLNSDSNINPNRLIASILPFQNYNSLEKNTNLVSNTNNIKNLNQSIKLSSSIKFSKLYFIFK